MVASLIKNIFFTGFVSLNQTKSVVKSKALGKKLVERLAGKGVANIQRIKMKKNCEDTLTYGYIVHFNKHTVPKVLKITDWHYKAVHKYVHKRQQCYYY